MMDTKFQKPKRLPGGKDTLVSQQRYELYKSANEQIAKAMQAGFFIEAVSICESIIGDRLEARIQFLKPDDDERHIVEALGNRLKYLRSIEVSDDYTLLGLYEEIAVWSRARNSVIHQFVKVTDTNDHLSVADRYEQSRSTAEEGKRLMREIAKHVQRLNKR